MKVVVLADTHIRRGGSRRLPDAVYGALEGAGAVLHAGDIVVPEVLADLAEHAPVTAVLGNNDTDPGLRHLPESVLVELGGVRVGMVHDSGPSKGRAGRLHRRFPHAAVVVFGHSHIPINETGVGGQLLFNPGSATERRRQPTHTFGVLHLEGGRVQAAEIHEVA